MNKLVKDALILFVITLVAGLALGAVEGITREPIARAEENTKAAAFKSLYPDAVSYETDSAFDPEAAIAVAEKDLPEAGIASWAQASGSVYFSEHVFAKDASGNVIGDIFTVTNKKSYGGAVTLSVGISPEGLAGFMITDISDTPGLGMKATEPKFGDQFKGLPVTLLNASKDAGASSGSTDANSSATAGVEGVMDIQAISGATITSKAVTNAIDAAIAYYMSVNGGAN